MILCTKTSHNHSLSMPAGGSKPLGNGLAGAATDDRFFYIDEFADEGAGETFMAVMPLAEQVNQPTPPRGLAAYFAHLWKLPVLNLVQEQHCFRKLSYLRYLLATSQSQSNCCLACREMQDDTEALQESIIRARNFLAESNLRLVVSIAKRHCSPSSDSFDELVCVGNVALIRAVDLFDFRRGIRFSTYAYQAIERSIFDAFRRDQRCRSHVATADDGVLELSPGDAGENTRSEPAALEAIGQIAELIEQLDDREQYIVKARFRINRPDAGVAFHVIAKEIKLSTTRTVQLFHRSIETMRHSLKVRHFD